MGGPIWLWAKGKNLSVSICFACDDIIDLHYDGGRHKFYWEDPFNEQG